MAQKKKGSRKRAASAKRPGKKAAGKRAPARRPRTAAKAKAAKQKPRARRQARSTRASGVDLADVRAIALELPGTEEGTSYGTPAWRVRGKLVARVHDSGESLVVRIDLDDRDLAMASDPETYYITDHYRDHPMMLVRFSSATRAELAAAIETSWRRVAPARLIAARDADG